MLPRGGFGVGALPLLGDLRRRVQQFLRGARAWRPSSQERHGWPVGAAAAPPAPAAPARFATRDQQVHALGVRQRRDPGANLFRLRRGRQWGASLRRYLHQVRIDPQKLAERGERAGGSRPGRAAPAAPARPRPCARPVRAGATPGTARGGRRRRSPRAAEGWRSSQPLPSSSHESPPSSSESNDRITKSPCAHAIASWPRQYRCAASTSSASAGRRSISWRDPQLAR